MQMKLETDLVLSQQQRDGFERTLRSHQDELRSLRSAAKEQQSAVRIANPEVGLGQLAPHCGERSRRCAAC